MKHPVFTNRVSFIMWWLVWVFLTLGQLLLYYFAYSSFIDSIIPDGLISMTVFSGIGLSLWYPLRYINTNPSHTTTGIMVNLIIIGSVAVFLWLITTKYFTILVLHQADEYKRYWEITFPYRIGTGIFIYCLLVLTYYLYESLQKLNAKKTREARLESLVKETELKMLRSQINPHFLFNSLNSVSSLTLSDPQKAQDMLIKLSDFMRYALSRKDEQPVALRSELENLRLYLEIEKVRFGNRLSTEENIEPGCLDTKMPVMILQPLYENAIKHGVYESTGGVRIITTVYNKGEMVEIVISNYYDTLPSSKTGTGTGLINVTRRLELFYGDKASVRTRKENGIFTVSLLIPSS